MEVIKQLKASISESIKQVYGVDYAPENLTLSQTKKEFDGAYTLVVFPLTKALKKAPPVIAEEIGQALVSASDWIESYNVIQGFLNLVCSNKFWDAMMSELAAPIPTLDIGKGKKLMVEFSSPNTNKPLHLGHIRNILLGWSIAQIGKATGYEVIKTQIINDRGIAICKSMLAWQLVGQGETPESSNTKGDHLVGKYYVEFEKLFQQEYKTWQDSETGTQVYQNNKNEEEESEAFFKRYKNQYFNEHSVIGKNAKDMLLKWEAGDTDTVALWKKMNGWVYKGFDVTYQNLGVDFDHLYYESETYLLGKSVVEQGISSGIFYKKEDGSVWVNLEDVGMDHKILLRSDGTSVYITQDIGTAQQRYRDHGMDKMIYVVADEQEYHFKALFATLSKLGEAYADQLHHLSYGMVDLPTGKMKSREGTVVDADDLMAEVIDEARQSAEERGGIEGQDEDSRNDIYRKIGLAALKYFIIKVNPRKRMTFNPKESVDMQGTTGPYIQNAYVRIQSIFRKLDDVRLDGSYSYPGSPEEVETELMMQLAEFTNVLTEAMEKYDPSLIANYAYAVAKSYHRFYHDCRILSVEDQTLKLFRLGLSDATARTIKKSMMLLGIEMPEYM
ncbi:MAG: arginine--tRNA ligase [Saprospiraceae bacterium]|nr:arginine--tRNA ligase [Saprospiraceae bacterium]